MTSKDIVWDSDLPWWVPPGITVLPSDRRLTSSQELTIDGLAQENAEQREHIESLEADVLVYRQMVQVLTERVRTLSTQVEQQREQMWIWRRDRANE